MKIQAASAIVPVAPHEKAVATIAKGLEDAVLGKILMEHVQICPQHAGYVNDKLVARLVETYPQTRFRLHASPKLRGTEPGIYHVSNAHRSMAYFDRAEEINKAFGASAYSIHAGERVDGTIDEMLDRLDMIQQRCTTRIAVEGLYPSKTDRWLMSTWGEYERVAERGALYALDLSHLNIVAKAYGPNDTLVRDLLQSEQCVEIHVSGNNGRADSHKPLESGNAPWWFGLLKLANPEAVIFYEGVLVDPKAHRTRPR
jgi:hypothetical protein